MLESLGYISPNLHLAISNAIRSLKHLHGVDGTWDLLELLGGSQLGRLLWNEIPLSIQWNLGETSTGYNRNVPLK